eukprot:6204296-Pleurochrysis_carterae.AAC.1
MAVEVYSVPAQQQLFLSCCGRQVGQFWIKTAMTDGKMNKSFAGQELSFQQIPSSFPSRHNYSVCGQHADRRKNCATAGSSDSNNKQICSTTASVLTATECLIVVPTTL